MKARQLPLSNLNNIPVEGMPEWVVVSGNSMDCAIGAAIIAKATGSVGATEIRNNPVCPPTFEDTGINKFAIIKRKNHELLRK